MISNDANLAGRQRQGSFLFLLLLLLVVSQGFARAADVYWTNTAGGNWNTATNWSSGTLPGTSDNVFITSDGTYTVVLNISATVKNLTLGGSSGTQSLSNNANNLTITSAGSITDNGVLSFGGGTLSGTNTLSGVLNWTGGSISSVLTVASNGTINVSGAATKTMSGLALTNWGRTVWTGSGTFSSFSATFLQSSGRALRHAKRPTPAQRLQ